MKNKSIIIIIGLGILIYIIFYFVYFKDTDTTESSSKLEYPINIDKSLISEENSYEFVIEANNKSRWYDLILLMDTIERYFNEKDMFPPVISEDLKHVSKEGADLCSYLVPDYIGSLSRDPRMRLDAEHKYGGGGSIYEKDCKSNYQTGYGIQSKGNEIILIAPLDESNEQIIVTRTFIPQREDF